ncbi:MAG: hypothetical protein HUJ26_03000 [Planctomycetaceae bacterium]|nr:hypothetical protein [Planctomycetaceae bacterium]
MDRMVDHSLPITDGPQDRPPVYDCRAVLTPPSEEELRYTAFAANLPEVKSTGPTERECLRNLVELFKAKLQEYHDADESIPWNDPPISPTDGQQQRWIPVHL